MSVCQLPIIAAEFPKWFNNSPISDDIVIHIIRNINELEKHGFSSTDFVNLEYQLKFIYSFTTLYVYIDCLRRDPLQDLNKSISGPNTSGYTELEGQFCKLLCNQVSVLLNYYCAHPSISKRLVARLIQRYTVNDLQTEETLALLRTFLSYGLIIDEDTITSIYQHYGFSNELEAIVYYGQFNENQFELLMNRYIFLDDPTRQELNGYSIQINAQNMNTYLAPSEFVPSFRVNSVKQRPRVPSLVELSRNQVHQHIKTFYNCKRAFEFYNVVKRLDIHEIYKDIISMKRPIYL